MAAVPKNSMTDQEANKMSIAFTLENRPGSLVAALSALSAIGTNLTKIESRPSKKRPWDYYFFIDVSGHYDDPAMREAVKRLRKFCPMVKWLGSYPTAK